MSDYGTTDHMPLFDVPARASDPQTSHDGAKSIASKRQLLRSKFVARVREIGMPCTANEVARGDESLRKRAGELVDDGLLAVTGTRKCSVTGKSASTYWIV